MVIQGSNNPFVIQFDTDVDEIPVLVITLWKDKLGISGSQLVKMWKTGESGISVSGDTVVCDITEEETSALSASRLVLEAKGLDEAGNTIFWEEYPLDVKMRRDRAIVLTKTGW